MKRLIEIDLQNVSEELAETFVYEVAQLIRKSDAGIIATWAFTGAEGFIVLSGKSCQVEDLIDDIYQYRGEFPAVIMEISKVKADESRDW